MEKELILLDLWLSPFGARVRIALKEKGLEYEMREEDLSEKSSYLLKMNPVHKQIPVLIHNGKPVCESLIIVEYIDEVWRGKAPLLPSDPHGRATARFWADYVDKKMYSVGRRMLTTKNKEQEEAKKELVEALRLLEGELGEKPYFGGESLGLVDVALIPFYSWFSAYKLADLIMAVEFPKLVEWANRCLAYDSVSKSLPEQEKVYDYFVEVGQVSG